MRGGRSAARRTFRLSGLISTAGSRSRSPRRGAGKRPCDASPKPAARGHRFPNPWSSAHRQACERSTRTAARARCHAGARRSVRLDSRQRLQPRVLMRRIGLAVALAVSLALAPPAASAQLGEVYRVGVLHPGTSQTSSTEAFRQALRELGYVEGPLGIEWRWAAGNPERYPDLATDLVRSNVDVIVAAHGETALAAKRATQTIPIVVAASVDAVQEGLVVSLAPPGGNVTGLSTMIPELTPKRFELLKEIVPGLSRVALLWNPEMGVALLKEHEAAARSVGLEPRRLAVRTAAELTQAFLEATRTRCGA